jgi:hypothetical protein
MHGAFLDALKYKHETQQGHALNATQWFMVLTQDPDYAWFRPFTSLITQMDILLDEKVLTEEQIDQIQAQLDELFFILRPENKFGTTFQQMIPNEPDMMMIFPNFREAHRSLKAAKTNPA